MGCIACWFNRDDCQQYLHRLLDCSPDGIGSEQSDFRCKNHDLVLDWYSSTFTWIILTLFYPGDVSLYGNWWERASQDGLAATATMYDESLVQEGYIGMISISVGLLFASGLLWKLMDKRWGKTHFIN